MNQDTLSIPDKMKFDLCERSPSAALGLAGVAIIMLFFPMTTSPDHLWSFRFFAALGVVLNLIRWFHARKLLHDQASHFQKNYRVHKTLIQLIAIVLSALFTISLVDPELNQNSMLATHIVIMGLAAASTSSTALVPRLQYFYLFFVAAIPVLSMGAVHQSNEFAALVLACLEIVFLAYLIGSSRQFYNNLVRRYEVEEALRIEKLNLQKAIEDLKEAQNEALKQTARAEYASKMASLGQMAGGVAHEINTPLAVIRTSADLLLMEFKKKEASLEKIEKWLVKIQDTTQRIAKIIKGLLSFSREGSKDPFSIFSLATPLEETLSFCRKKFESAGITLKVGPFPNVQIEGREVQLSQVFLNLLNNAFDAIKETAEPWIEIQVCESESLIEVSVTDSGQGIPADLLAQIFQPFFTTKDIGQGTGLGLSVSRGIIEDHGGTLQIDEDCPNTRFFFRIPKKQNV